MNSKFAIAPCSWGIEDPSNPDNPAWSRVLDDAAESGFSGIELGPYGYLPTNAEILKKEVDSRSLKVVAGTVYDDLTSAADRDALICKTKDICELLCSISSTEKNIYLVIIDAVKDSRNNTAGHSELAQRLPSNDWRKMMDNIKEISKIAVNDYGVKPVVHPHAGGYIEFRDETEKFLNDIPAETAGLCLDTGHIYYAGEDPSQSLVDLSERLEYVHFKDINPDVYTRALQDNMGFFDACSLGVMCSIGRGSIDYNEVFSALEMLDYRGWITVEQERDPKKFAGALADIKVSREFLIRTVSEKNDR